MSSIVTCCCRAAVLSHYCTCILLDGSPAEEVAIGAVAWNSTKILLAFSMFCIFSNVN